MSTNVANPNTSKFCCRRHILKYLVHLYIHFWNHFNLVHVKKLKYFYGAITVIQNNLNNPKDRGIP